MDDGFLIVALVGAIICGLAGAAMLDSVEKSGTGFWLGFLLGPIGVVIAWAKRDDARRELEERARRHRHVDDVMSNLRTTPRAPAPYAPIASGVGPSAIEELERLAALRERGHISEEEFNYRKRQLLGLPPETRAPAPAQRRFR